VGEISICGRTGQRQRRGWGFSARKRQRFLDALALTCNINAAAAYAGVHRTTPYWCRARDPQFAAQWREALAAGYDRLETLVLEHGGAGVALDSADPDRVDPADAAAPPPFDFDKAVQVLRLHRAERHALAKAGPGAARRRATREETNTALVKAIATARKRLEQSGDL
jgi:hypothetical protein